MEDTDAQTNTFSEEGRIHQVEYAIKSISSAGTSLGLVFSEGILLLGRTTDTNSIVKDEKIYRVNSTTYGIVGGLYADSNLLINYARVKAQDYLYKYDEDMSPWMVAKTIAKIAQSFTQQGGMRPFGVSFIIAGYNRDRAYEMYSVDPSGTLLRWSAHAFGEGEKTICTALEGYSSSCTKEEAVAFGLASLAQSAEGAADPSRIVSALLYHRDATAVKEEIPREELVAYLEQIALKKEMDGPGSGTK